MGLFSELQNRRFFLKNSISDSVIRWFESSRAYKSFKLVYKNSKPQSYLKSYSIIISQIYCFLSRLACFLACCREGKTVFSPFGKTIQGYFLCVYIIRTVRQILSGGSSFYLLKIKYYFLHLFVHKIIGKVGVNSAD